MKNIFSYKQLFNILIILLMVSCNEEQGAQIKTNEFRVSTEALWLTNDSTAIAGTIEVLADVPEIDLEWVTSPECKINTQLSKLLLENGKGVIPVEWLKPFENGDPSLAGTAFIAGVKITAGDETKYVSLLWGQEKGKAFDDLATRSLADERASSITFTPQRVVMNSQSGGATLATLTNVANAVVDYSGITPAMNINLSDQNLLPLVLTGSTPLVFTWAGTPPTTSFSTTVVVYGTGVPAANLELVYDASGEPGPGPDPGTDLQVSTVVPGGDIPDEGGTYYCNFTGTYTGTVIFRATRDGVEVGRMSGSVPSLLNVTIPGLSGKNSAQIAFEYSRDGGNTWILIERRVQKEETLSIYPIQPSGNIPSAGGTVTCGLYGTYSKRIAIHARVDAQVIASSSGTVPSTVSLQIPAYRGNNTRLIIFEYSKNNGPWLTLEVKRQLGY